MGRWRPPRAPASPYITPAGYQRLEEELKNLWLRRADVVKALSAAAAEGDRSENAEYIYRKKELGGIDSRIRYLQKRIPDLTVVKASPSGGKIYFGARVKLDRGGEVLELRLVGADEIGSSDTVSIDSPLARALLKHEVGDAVAVDVPEGTQVYEVLGVSYD